MLAVLLVALGGAVGSAARYLAATAVQTRAGFGFPLGTFVVNIVGSFLIGMVLGLFEAGNLSPQARLLIAVGFLGGFTTFSTFSYESLALIETRSFLYFFGNTLGSVVAGLVACWAGLVVARLVAALLRALA